MLNRYCFIPIVAVLLLASFVFAKEVYAQTCSVPLMVTVNGSLVVSDADNDTSTGKNPTKNVTLSVTPDIGQTTVTGAANFRVRTNRATWRVTTSRTAFTAGTTGLAEADVSVTITKSAGTTANAAAGALVAPFTAATTLTSIPTVGSADVISGTAKTSSAKDGMNTNNWFQVSTSYGVDPDFFYTPGTADTTITYNLVSP